MNSLEENKEQEMVPVEQQQNVEVEKSPEVVSEEVKAENQTSDEAVHAPDSEKTSEEAVQEPVQEEKVVQTDSNKAKSDYNSYDRKELVEALRELLAKEVEDIKEDVELIKQLFYKRQKAEIEAAKKSFIENGGEEADFKPKKDELEGILKTLLGDFRSKKAALQARIEQEKENNLLQKQHILEQMKTLTETTDDVSSHINEFKELQQKWKTIGQVPATMSTELWKQYNLYQEKFWDLIKINNELREYDFKKNLETKTAICEAAERLLGEDDIVVASRQLQKLHEEWREIGPVARDMRESVWNRFKEVTSEINKKHQAYYDGLKKGEEENETLKIAVCEKIEAVDTSELKTYNAWDKATETVMSYQEEWRAIGFAPRKVNQKLFERYRNACDTFFAAKAAFYKAAKAEMTENFEKKKALCEQAEAMKDSTDWKETSDKFVKIQREWKEIGPVQKKYSDELWKRFIAACDYFFEQKGKNVTDQRSVEADNLAKKQEIIAKIEGLDTSNPSEAYNMLKGLMEEFRSVGFVPFKEKDKVYKAYRTAIDAKFDVLNIDASNRRMESFRSNLEDMADKGDRKLYRERDKLVRTYEHLKSEIATYENNIGFFSATSKKADNMLKEMERKIENLKEECKLIEQKIELIDEKL
ncbi:DUF349 domain-containing protein [Paludibacter sp. 221]|uniref:DUF349 domain-containing protein n=1 Tax=Paludibacter sp. 221 TaxID=2302939 RepID=UPI0013D7D239|nr:DUF349 domain-containing protein [Paludibacter sp. 221]NDV47337.1 DUF349 domain-containing protein [Paludibacter sp. 221]